MTTTKTAPAGEQFEIEEIDLELDDWDRGIDRIHHIRFRGMSIGIVSGPGALQAAGFAVGRDAELSRDNAVGHARGLHYRMLVKLGKVPPLGPIRQTAGA